MKITPISQSLENFALKKSDYAKFSTGNITMPTHCPERIALLGYVLNYKTELAKLPPPQKLVSYFHIPVDDARTTATTNLRGGYSSLTSARDLGSSL